MNWAGLLQNLLVMVHLKQLVCGSLWISFPEEQEAGIRVGSLSPDYPPPYQLLTQEYLWMDQNTGDLYTTELKVDREALCPEELKADECIIQHNAIVGPSRVLIRFPVVIEDINDNAPHFENSKIYLSVPEDVVVGTCILLDDWAQDRDMGQNGELRYSLEGFNDVFSLTMEKGSVLLVVQTPLDREIQDHYVMTLVATDCGLDPLSARVTLTVNVTDVNDNCPRFVSESLPSVTITSGFRRDTVVAQVTATDSDLGPNAVITYSFSPKVSERVKMLFSLDSHTGDITLSQDLLTDSSEELALSVLARGLHCPPADTQVTVYVLPTPSQVPAIRIRFIAEHQNQTIVLPENQTPTVLAVLEVMGDRSIKGMPLIIENEGPFSLSLQNDKYLLSTSKPLDYEMKSEYHISVVVVVVSEPSQKGYLSASPRRVIRVRVVDLNDNSPQFSQTHYKLEVEENNLPGTPLLRVRASDADSENNGRITYRLEEHTSSIFSVDSVTGQLSVTVPLDREQQDVHTLVVLASDGGSPSLESTATVAIRVIDQNDNAPGFRTPHFIFFIPDNIPKLAQVGKVEVKDLDAGENGQVEVRVVNSSGPFVMDNAQGTLRCTANMDQEIGDRYELHLLASDNGQPSRLTSVARVTIFVEDVNDNQPKVILSNTNLTCFTVSPRTATGTVVAKINVTDEATEMNSEITYTLAGQEPAQNSSPFHLDLMSGNITLMQRLLGKDLGMHLLFIVVSDGGKPSPLHTTVWINLLVSETMESCHLDSIPRSLSYYRLPQPPCSSPMCEMENGTAIYACVVLLVGIGMMLVSICLFVLTAVLYLKVRKRRKPQNANEIPLRLKEKYYFHE